MGGGSPGDVRYLARSIIGLKEPTTSQHVHGEPKVRPRMPKRLQEPSGNATAAHFAKRAKTLNVIPVRVAGEPIVPSSPPSHEPCALCTHALAHKYPCALGTHAPAHKYLSCGPFCCGGGGASFGVAAERPCGGMLQLREQRHAMDQGRPVCKTAVPQLRSVQQRAWTAPSSSVRRRVEIQVFLAQKSVEDVS